MIITKQNQEVLDFVWKHGSTNRQDLEDEFIYDGSHNLTRALKKLTRHGYLKLGEFGTYIYAKGQKNKRLDEYGGENERSIEQNSK